MKRMLSIIGAALLGAVVYVSDPPTLPALELARDPAPVASAPDRSLVTRLAEAGMVWRRDQSPALGATSPDPEPGKLFQKKK